MKSNILIILFTSVIVCATGAYLILLDLGSDRKRLKAIEDEFRGILEECEGHYSKSGREAVLGSVAVSFRYPSLENFMAATRMHLQGKSTQVFWQRKGSNNVAFTLFAFNEERNEVHLLVVDGHYMRWKGK